MNMNGNYEESEHLYEGEIKKKKGFPIGCTFKINKYCSKIGKKSLSSVIDSISSKDLDIMFHIFCVVYSLSRQNTSLFKIFCEMGIRMEEQNKLRGP